MKNSNAKYYSVLFLVLGAVGLVLYRLIFRTAVGADGLIIRYTLPEILLWGLTACAAAGAVVLPRKCTVGQAKPLIGALGSLVYAAGVCTLLLTDPKGPAMLGMAYRGTAGLTVVSLVAGAIMQLRGREPHFAVTVAPCLMAILQLVECYQLWSERPLVLLYFFGLGAVLCVMLFSYHVMARIAKLPHKAMYSVCGLAGVFFCCVAAGQADFSIYFAAAALWMTAEMTALTPVAPEA